MNGDDGLVGIVTPSYEDQVLEESPDRLGFLAAVDMDTLDAGIHKKLVGRRPPSKCQEKEAP